jgi:hypothetical protein
VAEVGSMHFDVRPGEQLLVGGVRVELVHKSGRLARLKVTAPHDVLVRLEQSGEISSAHTREVVTSTAR